jgi:ABC-type phosphate/phosphonate transport system substrate-binding protein
MRTKVAAFVLAVILAGSLLAGCGGSGTSSLGKQACADVTKSVVLYQESVKATDPTTAKTLAAKATAELRLALPLAAEAASNNGTWQPLEANLSESNRITDASNSLNVGTLAPALTAQCQQDLAN